jgi:hypothetical protein
LKYEFGLRQAMLLALWRAVVEELKHSLCCLTCFGRAMMSQPLQLLEETRQAAAAAVVSNERAERCLSSAGARQQQHSGAAAAHEQ